MTEHPKNISDIVVDAAIAYGEILLSKRMLEDEKYDSNKRHMIARELLTRNIPYYKEVVPGDVQESLSMHINLKKLEEKCLNICNKYQKSLERN